jgi:VanZ family protein
LAIGYALVVFVACTVPVVPPHGGGVWTDKTDHLAAFVVFEVLVARALRAQQGLWRAHAGAVVIAAVYGALLEGWQGLLPWRSMELLDWVADACGALLGAAIHCVWVRSCKPASTA